MIDFKDASLLATLKTAITNVNVRVMETPLTDITYPTLVPVNTSYGEWQDTAPAITFGPGFGEAKWVTGYSKDVPLVEVSAAGTEISFDMFGIGWETNIEEVGKLAAVGYNISTAKAAVARRKSEEFVQSRVISGDAGKGWTGLVNKTGVTILPASTKAATGTQWVNNDGTLNATAQEIASDLINLVLGPVTATDTVRPIVADTVALPSLAYRALASTFTDALNGGVSYLEWVRRALGSIPGSNGNLRIVEIPELASAATTTIVGGGRALAYRNTQDVLELPMAAPFRFINEYKDAPYGWMIPGWGRFGQVQVYQTRGYRMMDGIQEVPA